LLPSRSSVLSSKDERKLWDAHLLSFIQSGVPFLS
jgi:hypothetical protein